MELYTRDIYFYGHDGLKVEVFSFGENGKITLLGDSKARIVNW